MAAPTYKPLLYTTTVRNPERYKDFMHILYRYEGKILNNELIESIEKEFFKIGLYRPMKYPISVKEKFDTGAKGALIEIALTDAEAKQVYDMNDPLKDPLIKGHKEKGFDKGWPSRFDTQFKFMKTLGFVNYSIGKPIVFSETGKLFASIVDIQIIKGFVHREVINPHYETIAFQHAFAKQQRCNPFIQELNDNIPLILLLKTIRLLNADPQFNNCGIAYHEIPLIIFWKDNDAEALYRRIKLLRTKYRYNVSDEVIIDICKNEILGGFKEFDNKSIMRDYPDEFIRKMRVTGLISFRGAGRFVDVNHKEDKKIDYIIDKYSVYEKYETEDEYYNYMSSVDPYLLKVESNVEDKSDSARLLNNWVEIYNWETIKKELFILSKRKSSDDNVLKFIAAPARLEFLTALAIKSKFRNIVVIPNYPCDDTGLPTSTAGGNNGDIECIEEPNGILVEVTMAEGRQQTMMEVWPIARHLADFQKKYKRESNCIFVAPSIFEDSENQIEWLKSKDTPLYIRPYEIENFVGYIENATALYN